MKFHLRPALVIALWVLAVETLAVVLVWPFWQGRDQLSPILLSVGPIDVRWYGVLMAIAIAAGYHVSVLLNKKEQVFSEEELANFALALAVGGVVGARLLFVALKWRDFQGDWLSALDLTGGGLSIHGAILGGLVGGLLFMRRFASINIWKAFDVAVPGLVLGQAIGRWGNFFNQEAYGRPTDGYLGLFIEPAQRLAQFGSNTTYHPAFFYESILDGLLFAFLFTISWKKPGVKTLVYVLAYSIVRFAVEYVRIDSDTLGGLSLAQWASLGLIIGTSTLLLRRREG